MPALNTSVTKGSRQCRTCSFSPACWNHDHLKLKSTSKLWDFKICDDRHMTYTYFSCQALWTNWPLNFILVINWQHENLNSTFLPQLLYFTAYHQIIILTTRTDRKGYLWTHWLQMFKGLSKHYPEIRLITLYWYSAWKSPDPMLFSRT